MSERPLYLLVALIGIPVILMLWRSYVNGRRDLRLLSGNWIKVDVENIYVVKSFFSSLFFVLFILLAVLSAAGFHWGSRPVPDERKGTEIVFVMDLSNSMLAEDVAPSRIKRAALLAKTVVQAAPGARVAVVGFKGKASLLLPATEDLIALDNLLSALHPDLITAPGTNIEAGLSEGLDSYTDIFDSHRIMVLFSDGEFLAGDPLRTAKRFAEEKVFLITVGVGVPAPARVPLPDGSFLTDTSGNELTTELRADTLEKLGHETGGPVLFANEPGVHDTLVKTISGNGGGVGWGYNFEPLDRYRLFLGAAMLSLAASFAIRFLRWRGTF